MQGNQPFEKVIKKIWTEIKYLESKMNSLPEVNLLTLPIAVLRSFLNPTYIKELQDELDNIRSKTQSTLEQYARIANGTRLESDPSCDETSTQTTYLSQIMEIMEYLSNMEECLKQKDIQQAFRQARFRDQAEAGWDDLKL